MILTDSFTLNSKSENLYLLRSDHIDEFVNLFLGVKTIEGRDSRNDFLNDECQCFVNKKEIRSVDVKSIFLLSRFPSFFISIPTVESSPFVTEKGFEVGHLTTNVEGSTLLM